MSKANELFQRARDLYNEAKAIYAKDDGDLDRADELVKEAEDMAKRARGIKQAEGFDMEFEGNEEEVEKKGIAEFRSRLEESFDSAVVDSFMKMLGEEGVELGNYESGGSDADRSLGDFLVSVRGAEKNPHYQKRLKEVYGSRKDNEAFKDVKDLVGNVGASGGYTVPTQEANELLAVDEGEAVVRPRARKFPMQSNSLTIPKLEQGDTPAEYWKLDYFGGVLSYWTAEAGAKTETEPEFGQIELNAHKLAGYTQASDELLADSGIGMASLLSDMFRGAISMREDFAFLRGNGVGMPLGILNSGVLLTEDRDTANEISFDDVTNMLGHFLPASFGNATWCVSHTALPQLLQMEDGAGNQVFIPNSSGGITQSIPGTILGRPVIVTEKLPALGSEGDLLLADFNYYIIGDRQQTTIASSEHYAFINDLTTWRFVHRVDGQPWLDAPIYIDTTNQVSPFVALAA